MVLNKISDVVLAGHPAPHCVPSWSPHPCSLPPSTSSVCCLDTAVRVDAHSGRAQWTAAQSRGVGTRQAEQKPQLVSMGGAGAGGREEWAAAQCAGLREEVDLQKSVLAVRSQ